MEMDKREFARQFAQKYGWTDLIKDPSKLTVEMIWRLYAENIFKGKEVSAIQYKETKQAFFVGFSECFRIMTDFASNLPEEQACSLFSNLAKESNVFIDSLIDRTLK